MKKILFLTNHLQYSDGVCNALVNLTNSLDLNKYELSVCSLFKYDEDFISLFDKRIKTFSVYKKYFRGFAKILKYVPSSFILHKILIDMILLLHISTIFRIVYYLKN